MDKKEIRDLKALTTQASTQNNKIDLQYTKNHHPMQQKKMK
mgnify:CR=1 FL=1